MMNIIELLKKNKQVDEYKDESNGITKVFAISRDEWKLKGGGNR